MIALPSTKDSQLGPVSVEEEGTPQCITFLHYLILGKGHVLDIVCSLPRNADLHGLHQWNLQVRDGFGQRGDQKAGGGCNWGIYSFGSLPAGLWVGCVTDHAKQPSLHPCFLRILNHSLPFSVFMLLLFLGFCVVDFSKLCLHLCKDCFY